MDMGATADNIHKIISDVVTRCALCWSTGTVYAIVLIFAPVWRLQKDDQSAFKVCTTLTAFQRTFALAGNTISIIVTNTIALAECVVYRYVAARLSGLICNESHISAINWNADVQTRWPSHVNLQCHANIPCDLFRGHPSNALNTSARPGHTLSSLVRVERTGPILLLVNSPRIALVTSSHQSPPPRRRALHSFRVSKRFMVSIIH